MPPKWFSMSSKLYRRSNSCLFYLGWPWNYCITVFHALMFCIMEHMSSIARGWSSAVQCNLCAQGAANARHPPVYGLEREIQNLCKMLQCQADQWLQARRQRESAEESGAKCCYTCKTNELSREGVQTVSSNPRTVYIYLTHVTTPSSGSETQSTGS